MSADNRTAARCAAWCAVALALVLAAAPAAGQATPPAAGARPWEAARARSGWGPFLVGSQAPYQQFRFSYLHESPEMLPRGALLTAVALTANNIWARDKGRHLVDGEFWRLLPLVRYAFAADMDASLQWPVLYLARGFADRMIEDYHLAVGFPNDGREKHPHNRLRFERTDSAGNTTVLLSDADQGPLVRAPVISLRWRLLQLRQRAPLTLKASVSLPALGERTAVVGRRGHDWALGLAHGFRFWGPLAGTASLAYVRSRPEAAPFTKHQWSGLLSLDYTLFPRFAIVGQMVGETPVNRGSHSGFDDPSFEGTLGAKWEVGATTRVEAAFTENLIHHDNTIDVGLHAGVTMLFP